VEPTKKPKLKYFNVVKSEAEKQINEFLSQNDSIAVLKEESNVMYYSLVFSFYY
jgi:hypothetical protein